MLPADRRGDYHDEGKDNTTHVVRHTYIYVLVSYTSACMLTAIKPKGSGCGRNKALNMMA